MTDPDDSPVQIPITGELDLHTFSPREVTQVIDAYFDACLERRILSVRVIHGKGTGSLRETVRAHLARHASVVAFRTGNEGEGGWGATIVQLRKDSL